MLKQAGPARAKGLSPGERATLTAVAEAVLPAGARFPGADARTVSRFLGYVGHMGDAATPLVRGLLHAVDVAAYARHLRGFARLSGEQRTALLESWRTGNVVWRTALRALAMPLKLAHFDDPAFYQAIGCVYEQPAQAAVPRPRFMQERMTRAADLPANEDLECDVVVVGTGAGGAVVARELAEQGVAVILLEEGEYHDRSSFTGRSAAMHAKLYRSMASNTTVGNLNIYVPTGRSVGGTTTINSGTCYRPPERVLRHWRDDLGLTDFTSDHLAPYFERVEDVLQVAPASERFTGGPARVIARGAQKLGYRHKPLLRNAPDCDGKGLCCFGCPTDAKRSTNVSYVPLALRAGAQLVTGAKVERVVLEGGRAAGVEVRVVGGERTLRVRARATVVACGTLATPVLLSNSGVTDRGGWLGGNLSLHPATGFMAVFDEVIDGWNSIPQGYAIEEFHDEGILFEGGTVPADMAAAAVPFIGKRLMETVASFEHTSIFGFMIEDTSRGRVHVRNGRSFISYVMNDHDVALMKRGIDILSRVFFAAGAKKVLPGVHGWDELGSLADLAAFRAARIRARDLMVSGYHPLGTARMSADPRAGVVGPDHQHHEVPDLYVIDGSSVPSSLAVNPQVTIMALATRAAEKLAQRLG
jgi:choline dehydrogenase-like flavoprotein